MLFSTTKEKARDAAAPYYVVRVRVLGEGLDVADATPFERLSDAKDEANERNKRANGPGPAYGYFVVDGDWLEKQGWFQ